MLVLVLVIVLALSPVIPGTSCVQIPLRVLWEGSTIKADVATGISAFAQNGGRYHDLLPKMWMGTESIVALVLYLPLHMEHL